MQYPAPTKTVRIPDLKAHFSHEAYYPYQKEILDILQANYGKYEYYIIEAPPGVGKTSIADAFIASHKHGEVLTKQIRLQNQYIEGYGFVKVQGRSNFNCSIEALSCDRGKCLTSNEEEDICKGCVNAPGCDKSGSKREKCENERAINNEISKTFSCENKPIAPKEENRPDEELFAAYSRKRGKLYWQKLDNNCEYWSQKIEALNSPKVAHNYSYFLYESEFAGDFGSPEVLVSDEAHTIEQTLMDFVSVKISARELERIGVNVPYFTDASDWITWLESLHNIYIPERLRTLQTYFNNTKDLDHNKKVEFTRLQRLDNKIEYFVQKYNLDPGVWLFLPYLNHLRALEKIEFRPMFVYNFAEDKLFRKSKHKLLMSATILDFDVFKRSIGIQNKSCLVIQVPSPFPVENRPIYKANIGHLDAKAINPNNEENSLDNLMSFIDETLENPHFRRSKGVIHTTTYKMADYIKEHCAHAPRMLFHSDSTGANEILEQHKETNQPTVIVSPSMTEGVSFDDDLARFQIPIRVPFLNVGDPVIKARAANDRPWYFWVSGVTLFQTFGRVVRNMQDYAVTIMPDSRISYFLNRQLGYKKVPGWIQDSMKKPEELEADYNLTYDFSGKKT